MRTYRRWAGLLLVVLLPWSGAEVAAGPPSLRVERGAGSDLVISWPAEEGAGFVLQVAPSVAPGDAWVAWEAGMVNEGGRFRVAVTPGAVPRFFRLAKPSGEPDGPVVLESAASTLGPGGGVLSLREGGAVSLAAGLLTAPVVVSLENVRDPLEVESPGSRIYDVRGAGLASVGWVLRFPGPPGRLADELAVVRVDVAAGVGAPVAFGYDAVSGRVTVTNRAAAGAAGLQGRPQGLVPDCIRYKFEWEAHYVAQAEERVIPMPFYDQIGGSCWASDTLIVWRALSEAVPGETLASVLRGAAADDLDFGSSQAHFQGRWMPYLADLLGTTVHWRGYLTPHFLRSRIVRELDLGHPVFLRVPGNTFKESNLGDNEMGGHALLVVGYETRGARLILHDTKNRFPVVFAESQMYTSRPFSWVESVRLLPFEIFQMAWVDRAMPSGRTLLTLGLPLANQSSGIEFGALTFRGRRSQGEYDLAVAKLVPSAPRGYVWTQDPVMSLAQSLVLDLPVWNADFVDRQATVRIRLTSGGVPVLASTSAPVRLAAAQLLNTQDRTGVRVPFVFGMDEVRRPELGDGGATMNLEVTAELADEAGRIVDGWQLRDARLSLAPSLTFVGPCFGKIGDVVSLHGAGFGRVRPESAGVWFHGALASEYLEWTDTHVRVKVPAGATTGDVVLALRSDPAYRTRAKPFEVVEKLPYPRITQLSGTFDPATWQFEHVARWTGGTGPFTVTWKAGETVLEERVQSEFRRTVAFRAAEIADGHRPGEGYFIRLLVRDSKGQEARWYSDRQETGFYVVWDEDTMETSTTIPSGFPYPEPGCP